MQTLATKSRAVPGFARALRPAPLFQRTPAVRRILRGAQVQAKLKIGAVNDPAERAPDRVADRVMRMPDAAPVRTSAAAEETLQRLCEDCEKEKLQRQTDGRSGTAGGSAAPAADGAIGALGGGAPLPASERAFFEARFGRAFSNVRVPKDAAAGAAARSIDARAFTLGSDIAFASGEYAPGTAQGRRLLAHELTHVVQQTGTSAAAFIVRRQLYDGCDEQTTGAVDADARIDRGRDEALRMVAAARARFPRMSSRTIRLADRHFHCPSSSNIATVIASLATIEQTIPLLSVRCLPATSPRCARGVRGGHIDDVMELCPRSFAEAEHHVAGSFIWAAAAAFGGMRSTCDSDRCWNDFTLPARDMVRAAHCYRNFVIELDGHAFPQPATIPCAPLNTRTYVFVPPGALSDPTLIRPVTGYEPRPAGSVVLTVYKDRADNYFIYHDDLPGAQQYRPDEPRRYYFPAGREP
jgi:hypothetical protein